MKLFLMQVVYKLGREIDWESGRASRKKGCLS